MREHPISSFHEKYGYHHLNWAHYILRLALLLVSQLLLCNLHEPIHLLMIIHFFRASYTSLEEYVLHDSAENVRSPGTPDVSFSSLPIVHSWTGLDSAGAIDCGSRCDKYCQWHDTLWPESNVDPHSITGKWCSQNK